MHQLRQRETATTVQLGMYSLVTQTPVATATRDVALGSGITKSAMSLIRNCGESNTLVSLKGCNN